MKPTKMQFDFIQRRWFKQLKTLFGFIFLFSVSFACITADKPYRYHSSPIFINIMGWIGIIFLGLCAIVLLFRELRFRGRSQAVITDEGLYITGECIPWSVITEVKKWRYRKDVQGLYVVTTNCEELIAAAPWWKRWNMKFNYRQYGAVYFIPYEMFDGTNEAFIEACEPYIKRK